MESIVTIRPTEMETEIWLAKRRVIRWLVKHIALGAMLLGGYAFSGHHAHSQEMTVDPVRYSEQLAQIQAYCAKLYKDEPGNFSSRVTCENVELKGLAELIRRGEIKPAPKVMQADTH
jgi:hypothetical protein